MPGKRISDEQLITALSVSTSIADTAKDLGITRQAIYNRLQKPEFRKRLQSERDSKFQVAGNQLAGGMSEAIQVILAVMKDAETAPGVRVKAGQILLDICLRTSEQLDILSRIENLERMLAEGNDSTDVEIENDEM